MFRRGLSDEPLDLAAALGPALERMRELARQVPAVPAVPAEGPAPAPTFLQAPATNLQASPDLLPAQAPPPEPAWRTHPAVCQAREHLRRVRAGQIEVTRELYEGDVLSLARAVQHFAEEERA
jgi:hypothetical protein